MSDKWIPMTREAPGHFENDPTIDVWRARAEAAEADAERLAEVLRGIQGMAAEELRTEELRPSTLMWQIEADARAALAAHRERGKETK